MEVIRSHLKIINEESAEGYVRGVLETLSLQAHSAH